ADALVPVHPAPRGMALPLRDDRQHRHVAGAVRHRRGQPVPRLRAVLVGPLHADVLGLVDVRRHDRSLPRADVPVHPAAAHDLDLRDAGDPAGGEGRGGRGVSGPRMYGLMAEFENPQDLVEATRQTREAGFTKIDAYSPYPIEALTEALDIHDHKLP